MPAKATLEYIENMARPVPNEPDYVCTADELGDAWNEVGNRATMAGKPEEFEQHARDCIGQMAIDHIGLLRDAHPFLVRDGKRWSPKRWHLVGEGIAIGIKLGILIGERRRG